MLASIYRNKDGVFGMGNAHLEQRDARLQEFLAERVKSSKAICQCCGFISPKYQKAIDANCGVGDFNPIIVCPFCYYSLRLEIAGKDGAGQLVYVPTSQAQINWLMHALMQTAITKGNIHADYRLMDTFFVKIKRTAFDVAVMVGPSAHKPETMALALKNLSDQEYASRGSAISMVKFLPDKDFFKEQFEYWNAKVYPFLDLKSKK